MAQDSRLVRELLAANTALTQQIVELARFAIGAPQVIYEDRAPIEAAAPNPAFEMSTADDWEDIPDLPPAQLAEVLQLRRPSPRAVNPDLPLHMTEEEEDLRYSVGMGQEAPKALSDFLKNLEAPGTAVLLEPLA